jgi:hypothetical protein
LHGSQIGKDSSARLVVTAMAMTAPNVQTINNANTQGGVKRNF